MKRSLHSIINQITNVHNRAVILVISSYKNINTKCKFIDKEYGEFFMTPNHVLRGSGHKQRAIDKQTKQNQLKIKEVEKRLYKQHKGIIKIYDFSYHGLYHKALFLHKNYGFWWSIPNNVLKGSSHPKGAIKKSKKTFIKNYGVDSPMKNKTIFDKASKSRWKTIIIKHWDTDEDLICMSSYEYALVKYLNKNKIAYVWQILFNLPNEMVYYIDLYLKNDDKFIEIKGIFWNKKNKYKWDWFHKNYKNSELWQIDKIKKLTGKSEYRIKKEFKDDWKNQRANGNKEEGESYC